MNAELLRCHRVNACPDALASLRHLNRAVVGPGAVANEAEEKRSPDVQPQ